MTKTTAQRAAVDAEISSHPYDLRCWGWGAVSVGGESDDAPRFRCPVCRDLERIAHTFADGSVLCHRCAYLAHLPGCPLAHEADPVGDVPPGGHDAD